MSFSNLLTPNNYTLYSSNIVSNVINFSNNTGSGYGIGTVSQIPTTGETVLNLKSLNAGTNITISEDSNNIIINSTSAGGSEYKYIYFNNDSIIINSDGFIGYSGFGVLSSSASYAVANSITFKGMYVSISSNPLANSWKFTLQQNGVDTSFNVSITNSTSTSFIGDLVLNQGDLFSLAIDKVGTPAAITSCHVTLYYI